MRRGELYQYRAPSGGQGRGVVAWVVQFPPNADQQQWVVAIWMGEHPYVGVWPSIDDLLEVHGHLGASEVRWLDSDPFDTDDESELLDACSQPT